MNKLEYIPGDIVKIEYGEATGKIGFVTNTFLRRKGCYSLVVFIGKGFQGSSKDERYYQEHKEHLLARMEVYRKENAERIAANRRYNRKRKKALGGLMNPNIK